MSENLPEWNEESAKLIFEAIPEANWVACDKDGTAYWLKEKPTKCSKYWAVQNGHTSYKGYLGNFFCPDWTKSLYERKWVPKINEKVYFVDFWNPFSLIQTFRPH